MDKPLRITGHIFISFSLLISYFLAPRSLDKVGILQASLAFAQTPTCAPLYGGGPMCERHPDLSIDKQIQDPQTKKYLDNITTVSNYLPADQTITFRIVIKNTSNKTIANITVTDILPTAITFKSGNGKYDSKTSTFTDTIEKLDKGQTHTYTVTATVNTDALQTMSACSVNQAVLSQGSKRGSDYASFCINVSQAGVKSSTTQNTGQTKGGLTTQPQTTKGGLPVYGQKPVSKTPDTGPEALAIISLPTFAGIGYYLRKSSNRFKKHDS